MNQLKRSTVLELGEILRSKYNYGPSYQELEGLAYRLVGSFSLLAKAYSRGRFGNSSSLLIDLASKESEDKINVS